MSVLIKGMKMPKNCEDCRFCYQDQDSEHDVWNRCTALNHNEIIAFRTMRRSDCPLIEVPPHGRLIDADELIVFEAHVDGAQNGLRFVPAEFIEAAPTIIEAEEADHASL